VSGDKVKNAPLDATQLAKLRALVKPGGAGILLADFPGVGGAAMARALAGLPVRAATAELIRLGLERLAKEKVRSDFEGMGR
jgi:hypothetical protein